MALDAVTAGKAAALLAALMWAFTVTVFTFASRRVGAQVVNATRLVLALFVLLIIHWIWAGTPWPQGLGAQRTFWLLVSGLIGFSISDGFALESFMRIGPRLGMLVQTLAPIFSAGLAWIFLGQALSWPKGGAIVLTLAGVILVVGQAPSEPHKGQGARVQGILYALGAALGQSLGQLTSVQGMSGGVSPLSANVVRLLAGTLGILAFLILQGPLRLSGAWKDRRTVFLILVGTALGPTGGVLLALYGMSHAPLGIVATLMFMVPIFMLPIARICFHDPITPRALAGTLLTVGGACALFLLP